jgi:hypothetical protein
MADDAVSSNRSPQVQFPVTGKKQGILVKNDSWAKIDRTFSPLYQLFDEKIPCESEQGIQFAEQRIKASEAGSDGESNGNTTRSLAKSLL